VAIPIVAAGAAAAAAGTRGSLALAGKGAFRWAARELASGALFYTGQALMEWFLNQWSSEWDPQGSDPYPVTSGGACGFPWKIQTSESCAGATALYRNMGDGDRDRTSSVSAPPVYTEITAWRPKQLGSGAWSIDIDLILPDGSPYTFNWQTNGPPTTPANTVVCVYMYIPSSCSSAPTVPGPEGGPVEIPTVEVTEGDCIYNVDVQAVIVEKEEPIGVLSKVETKPGTTSTTCNYDPTYVFVPPVGDPIPINPHNEWGEELTIEEIVKKIKNPAVEEINNNTDERIQEYFDARVPVIAGGAWDLQGVCEKDAEGAIIDPQPTTEWTYEGGSAAVVANYQLMLMQEMLQQQLDWRHLTCGGSKPELQGDWVSTGWMSIEASENSNRPLRKLFRYRSLGDRDVVALLGYWKDFQWEAGPVCVVHTKAWWGLLQVWAASEEEGKRVIRFAGVNAGIDPDTEGTWQISTSTGSRYGRTGTMTLACYKGQYHVSARDTPDWPTMQPGEIYES